MPPDPFSPLPEESSGTSSPESPLTEAASPDTSHRPDTSHQRIRRRRFLTCLSLGTITGATVYRPLRKEVDWATLSRNARGFSSGISSRLEEEWHRLQRSFLEPEPTPRTLESEKEYRAFLSKIPLRYINPEEVIRPHRNIRDGVPNELPPRSYWGRIEKTLRVADEIRHRLGQPLYCINSAYRSPAYNAACPGTATWSYHMKNQALDLMFTGGSAAAAEVAKKLREEKFFAGGIGTYAHFIHVDTRGSNATWGA